MTYEILTYILGGLTIGTALMVILSKHPLRSVLYLVVTFFLISGHFLLMNAQFIAIVNVIVYAGAIMVLFLFTIMLMNLNKEDEVHKPRITRIGALIVFLIMSIVFITIFINSKTIMTGYDTSGEDFQSIKVLGKVLLNEYMFPFEFISILLLVAMIGTVLLTKKEKNNE
jgi:NADH-quinone oxidoreductase subunit J